MPLGVPLWLADGKSTSGAKLKNGPMWLVNGTQSLYTFSVYTIFLILFGEPHFVEEKAFLHKTVFVANCSQSLFQPFPARITVAFSYFYSTQDILYSAHIKVDAIKEKSFQLLFYQIKNRRDMIGHRGPTLAIHQSSYLKQGSWKVSCFFKPWNNARLRGFTFFSSDPMFI